ncbi:STAM-binding protein-like A isoform X1 [Diorhabda sublineata]|uniref:STAM-binding protein-like A isoform X1 n=1 Tax=Diorhabda sublineata TaxID=1163346 RepID=UPI0024E0EE3D|nr:STAM-binding protein-like A isoform X1 [Diorhabda sublineata]
MTHIKSKDTILDTLEPQVRLKQLIDYSNQVEADPRVPPIRLIYLYRYYRSGQEMIRMANVYYKEGSLENAYVLYLKFMTLFLEKIRKHPQFSSVAVNVKAKNQATLREILPRAEKIKQQLLEQYTSDIQQYLAEKKKLENELKRTEEQNKLFDQRTSKSTASGLSGTISIVKVPENLDNIAYPESISHIPPVPPPSTVAVHKGFEVPKIDRTKKPSNIFRYDTNILRPVIVPVQVMTLFQAIAQSNTFKNIETCGVLCGKLEKNELIITHMILPKQKGTSDSCCTTNEEEIFEYQDVHNLITIGWIHTHPTQTAFLSSVDLHTHCPYQLLMPEAIAIVCSPKYNETGIFILTPDYGLKFIANCNQDGFHPHPTDPPLFTEADHVRIENNASVEVLDLRKK